MIVFDTNLISELLMLHGVLWHYSFSPGNVEWWLQQSYGSNKLQNLQRSKTSVPKSESYSDFPKSETALRKRLNFLKEKANFCRAQGLQT